MTPRASAAHGQLASGLGLVLLGCGARNGSDATAALRPGCVAQVAAVYDEVPVVLRTDGTVWVAADTMHFKPIAASWGALGASQIAASGSGDYGTAVGCAIVDAHIWCFPLGPNVLDSTDLGAGLGPGVTTSSAVQVVTTAAGAPLAGATQISGGTNGSGATFCAVTSDGSVLCWGHNPSGVLGDGDTMDEGYARPVVTDGAQTPLTDVVEVRIGYLSTCARKRDASVWCWGDNSLGQLGSSAPAQSLVPIRVPLPRPAVRLAASPGDTHCAILQDTSAACWGWNQYAQAGSTTLSPSVGPTVVLTAPGGPPLLGVVDMAPDHQAQAMCASTKSSGLLCWGNAFDAATGVRAITAYPVAPSDLRAGVAAGVPLGAYGASDGVLVYVNPEGLVAFGAGAPPYPAQPPCP
jgi:hypothetical protein